MIDRALEDLSLQSDFSSHSLINLFGPAELRAFIHAYGQSPRLFSTSPKGFSSAQTVLGPDFIGFPQSLNQEG
jgi:hypothetical protein